MHIQWTRAAWSAAFDPAATRDAQQVQQQLQQQLREAAARAAAARTIEPDEEEQPQQKQPAATVPGMPAGACAAPVDRGRSRPSLGSETPRVRRGWSLAGDEEKAGAVIV